MFEKPSINFLIEKFDYSIFLWGNNYTYPASQRTLIIKEFFKNRGIKITGDNSYGNSILKTFSNRFNYPISEIEIDRLPIAVISFDDNFIENEVCYSDDLIQEIDSLR